MQEQEARLPRDRDANFVGELEAAGSLEMFFREKYLGVAEQLRLISRREPIEHRKISLEDSSPFRGRGLGAQARAPAGLEEIEDHG